MPKLSWAAYVAQHPTSPGFVANVSKTMGKGPQFDKQGALLPTPYALFQEWLRQTLTGDWASMSIPGGFAIRLSATSDMQLVQQKYPISSTAKKTGISSKTFQLSYWDSSYGALATQLGYVVR